MRRWQSIAVLVVGTVLWSVQPAYANLWDWLQELSGPGPFHARRPNAMFELCREQPFGGKMLNDFGVATEIAQQAQQPNPKPVVCWFADARFFANNDHDNFGVDDVHLDIYEFGASTPLHRAASLGFGAGLMHISTPGHDTNKFVLTTPRLVIKPLLLYGPNDLWDSHHGWRALASSVKFYVKADIIVGDLTGADFGVPNNKFEQRHERVASTGFIIDTTPLVAFLKTGR